MLVTDVLKAKVINQEGELYRAGFVFPEFWRDSALVVSVVIEA